MLVDLYYTTTSSLNNKAVTLSLIYFLFGITAVKAQTSKTTSPDSIYIVKSRNYTYRAFVLPSALIITGAYLTVHDDIRYNVNEWRDENYSSFHTEIDNYLQFVPFAIVGVMELSEKNSYPVIHQRALHFIKTEVIMSVLTYTTKTLTKVERPDGSANNSFPSGHTAQAFAAATFLYNEYGKSHSIWFTIGGYAAATATGVLRILNDKHWISDVIAGAGVGILSANLGCMDWHSKKRSNVTGMLVPQMSKDFKGACLLVRF